MEPIQRSQPAPARATPRAEEEEEELEEPEEGDYVNVFKYQFAKFWRNARDPIKKNAPKFLLAIGIIALAYWFFFIKPQPGTLNIEAAYIDNNERQVIGAAVSLSYADGTPAVDETITDENGFVTLVGVPAEEPLVLRITPSSSKYDSYRTTIELSSQQTRRIEALLGKKTGLAFMQDHYDLSLPAGCSRTLPIEIENRGSKEEVVTLVADEDMVEYVRPLSSIDFIAPGEIITVPVVVRAGDGDYEGNIRFKETALGTRLTVKESQDIPKLSVRFDKSNAADFQTDSSALPAVMKSQVIISNNGRTGTPYLTDINISVSGDLIPWVALDLELVDEANRKGGIAPEKDVLFGYTVIVPIGTPTGPYTGRLRVQSACDEVHIPLNIVVN
ncbi:hypothetical protein KJ765_01305 [Candidatus Micrarchaeota archaeon]|nr:hypothetical protein [Candidatus Micrarchaeota archaeon]